MLLERRRSTGPLPGSFLAYPMLDLNDPKTRRTFLTFMVLTFFFIAGQCLWKLFEHLNSPNPSHFCGETCHTVMKPEFVAYMAGAHSRVRCVDCHVGEGADWYVRSTAFRRVSAYSVAFEKYSRPIGTPVHNLRPDRNL